MWVVENQNGLQIFNLAIHFKASSPLTAEARACFEDLKWMESKGFNAAKFYTDGSVFLIKGTKCPLNVGWFFRTLIMDICKTLKDLSKFIVCKVSRQFVYQAQR